MDEAMWGEPAGSAFPDAESFGAELGAASGQAMDESSEDGDNHTAPEAGAEPLGPGSHQNCMHEGREYSPGDTIRGADGALYACHAGQWVPADTVTVTVETHGGGV